MKLLVAALLFAAIPTVAGTQTCNTQPVVTIENRGRVMTDPRVHFIFWGQYWKTPDGSAMADQIVQGFARVPEYFSGLSQYGVGQPRLAGMTSVTTYEPPSTLSYGDVPAMIQSAMDARIIPSIMEAYRSVYFVVLLPPSTSTALPYPAYHNYIQFPRDYNIWYAAIIASPSTVMYYVFHELVEGMTDPEGKGVQVTSGKSHPYPSWEEISDPCFSACGFTNTVNGVQVAAYWSQSDGMCIAPAGNQSIRKHPEAPHQR